MFFVCDRLTPPHNTEEQETHRLFALATSATPSHRLSPDCATLARPSAQQNCSNHIRPTCDRFASTQHNRARDPLSLCSCFLSNNYITINLFFLCIRQCKRVTLWQLPDDLHKVKQALDCLLYVVVLLQSSCLLLIVVFSVLFFLLSFIVYCSHL